MNPRQPTWLRRPEPRHAPRLTLVCLHHAGGSASFFRRFARLMPEGVEPVTAQLPGRGDRLAEPAWDDLDALAEALAPVVDTACPGPVAVFGYSMGARLGLEVVRRLETRRDVVGLVAAASTAPTWPAPRVGGPMTHGDALGYLRGLGGTPDEVLADADLMDLLLPAIVADLEAVRSHEPLTGAPVSTPILTLGGAEDAAVPEGSRLAWSVETSASYTDGVLAGGHFFLQGQEEEVVGAVADWLGSAASPDC